MYILYQSSQILSLGCFFYKMMVIKFVQRSFDSLTMSGLHIGNDFEKSLSAIKIMIVFLFFIKPGSCDDG